MDWPPSREQWSGALDVAAAICLFIGSTADLGLSPTAVRWIIVLAGIATLIRRRIDERRVVEALYTEPPPPDRVPVPEPPEERRSYD